ncbi:MAG: MASE3 domain-containing protein [Planctomycetota bacterium]
MRRPILMTTETNPPLSYTTLAKILIVLGVVSLLSLFNFLFFHTVAEIFTLVIACGIFIIAWNCRGFMANQYLMFLGIAFLFMSVIDLFHTLSYPGMGVFREDNGNLTTQFWMGGRYLESIAFLLAPLAIRRAFRTETLLLGYAVATGAILGLMGFGAFPSCVDPDGGLTRFKVWNEYAIIGILAVSLGLLYRVRGRFPRDTFMLMSLAILLTMASESAFTVSAEVYGYSILIGHLFRIGSFCVIYKAIIETGLRQPYGLLFRDLKASEENLRTANERLRQGTRELEEANRELDAFSQGVAHDLKRPLTTIQGFADLLAAGGVEISQAEQREYAARIGLSTRRMDRLIEDLLDLAHIRRGELNIERVALSREAEEIARKLTESEPRRRAEFRIQPDLSTWGDRRLLRVVLENLFANAWKFARKAPQTLIEFGTDNRMGEPIYFVRDNGAGFNMAKADRLFRPFERLHPPSEFEGAGVGLATIRRILERHGGKIWAEAAVGLGATFFFTVRAKNP